MTIDSDHQEERGASGNHATSSARAWNALTHYLDAQGLRVTKARRNVFNEVFGRHDHFSADELANELARGPERVSRSTVYNTLSLLVEAGLVAEICNRQGHIRYEHTFGHPAHEHMICEECGVVFEFSDTTLADAIEEDCQRTGFVRYGHRVTVFGVCREFAEGRPHACTHYRTRRRSM